MGTSNSSGFCRPSLTLARTAAARRERRGWFGAYSSLGTGRLARVLEEITGEFASYPHVVSKSNILITTYTVMKERTSGRPGVVLAFVLRRCQAWVQMSVRPL